MDDTDKLSEPSASISVQCPSCTEEVELELAEVDATDSIFCGECGTLIPVDMDSQNRCPQCNASRKRGKDGKFKRFCFKCRYKFSDVNSKKDLGM